MTLKLGHLEMVRARLLIYVKEPILITSGARRAILGIFAGRPRWCATRLLTQLLVHQGSHHHGLSRMLSRCGIASVVHTRHRPAIRLMAITTAVGVAATESGLYARSRVRLCT